MGPFTEKLLQSTVLLTNVLHLIIVYRLTFLNTVCPLQEKFPRGICCFVSSPVLHETQRLVYSEECTQLIQPVYRQPTQILRNK